MDSSGFSSPRSDCFPAGLRVLVVDDDPTWLKILEKMLKKCNYEVTTCNLAREALDLLRERKDGFDIVISDVNMPDMDGFKLLEHVGLEMDLPVIMMSVDGETSRVMKGVQHGACDYLLKPIRMKELRNIWQHVFRKRIHEVRDIEGHESFEEIQMMRCGSELSDDGFLFCGDVVSGRKRKDENDRLCGDPSSSVKKARVVWTVDLHQKFVKAVNHIGFDKVGPKKILDLMGVPWLTRENVASHLQKYRLYLTRLQKENEMKATFGGTKHSDISSAKDHAGNVLADENYAVSGHKIPTHHDEPKMCEGNIKGTHPVSTESTQNEVVKNSTSRISYEHSFRQVNPDVKSEPRIQVQYSWSAGVPLQFKQEHKPPFQSRHGFDHIPIPVHQIQLGHNAESASKEPDKLTQKSKEVVIDKPESHLANYHSTDQIPSSIWSTKSQSLDPNLFDDLGSTQRSSILGTGSALRLWDEDPFIEDYSSQVEYFYPHNTTYQGSIDPLGYTNQDLIADFPPHLSDSLKFDCEFQNDTVEYPVMDQGVYI